VARKKGFLAAEFSNRFQESYAALSHDRQKAVDKVVLALMKQDVTPGLRVKPIQPEKYYREARINDGDRLVYRIDEGKLWVIDVVSHDDIVRYGKKVKGS
jgi:mRNA-degrading endonuclease YafQ of YafQ-DinJ toxin-antitoxin module